MPAGPHTDSPRPAPAPGPVVIEGQESTGDPSTRADPTRTRSSARPGSDHDPIRLASELLPARTPDPAAVTAANEQPRRQRPHRHTTRAVAGLTAADRLGAGDAAVADVHITTGTVTATLMTTTATFHVTWTTGNHPATQVTVEADTADDLAATTRHLPAPNSMTASLWTADAAGLLQPQPFTMPDSVGIDLYPTHVARHLTELARLPGPPDGGRVLIWHGPPGTGKTTAAAHLAAAWSPWCTTHVIGDPDALFASTTNLLRVTDDTDTNGRWQLIIIEDTDTYLDAHAASSIPLSRLLNVTDGLLGHRSRSLFLLTSNLRARQLHPAIIRPGRAGDITHFELHSRDEATRFLAQTAPTHPEPLGDMSLAELVAISHAHSPAPFPTDAHA